MMRLKLLKYLFKHVFGIKTGILLGILTSESQFQSIHIPRKRSFLVLLNGPSPTLPPLSFRTENSTPKFFLVSHHLPSPLSEPSSLFPVRPLTPHTGPTLETRGLKTPTTTPPGPPHRTPIASSFPSPVCVTST